MKRSQILLAIVAMCFLSAVPASASDRNWHLRLAGVGFDPDLAGTTPNPGGGEILVTGESDTGAGLSVEYQFNTLVGVEFGFATGTPDVKLSTFLPGYGNLAITDGLSTDLFALDVDFHLTPESRLLDLYLGAGVARLSYGDLHYNVLDVSTLDLGVANDTTWSVKAGLDISFGRKSRWAAVTGLRYVPSELEVREAGGSSGDSESFDFDLLNYTLGVRVSF